MFTKEMVLFKLLPTLEALQPALQQAPDEEQYKIWKTGVEGIVKEMEKTLADLGVERIKTVGENYNHELHEAIEMLEGKEEAGKILEEIAPGYKINGKVIRPA
jgi:molecular chaperone GrpE